MKPLLIVKTGDTFAHLAETLGDFEDWVEAGLGRLKNPVTVFDPRCEPALPAPEDVAGAVVTGSHAMVTDRAPWSESLARWLVALVRRKVPVLGICYGHQLLAHALEGEVGYRPDGMEIGPVGIWLEQSAAEDALFSHLTPGFSAHAVHSQSVLRLPPGAVLLARSEDEPHAAFRVGACAWGVQFHPEYGIDVMAGYIRCLEPELRREGRDVRALLESLAPTDAAALVLRRFGAFVERCHRAAEKTAAPVPTESRTSENRAA